MSLPNYPTQYPYGAYNRPPSFLPPVVIYGICGLAVGHIVATLIGSCATWSMDTRFRKSLTDHQCHMWQTMRTRHKALYFSALRSMFVASVIFYIFRNSFYHHS